MKIVFITFATKNTNHVLSHHNTIHDAGLRLKKQANDIGLFDECILYTEDFLKTNSEFWDKHQSFVEKYTKGYGYYIWKPYVIKKTMEKMSDGDILLYLDAGCEIDSTQPQELNKLIEKVKTHKIVGAGTGFSEFKFTKKDLFITLGMYNIECLNSVQHQGGTNFFLVCDRTRKLVDEWYETGCDYKNINDSGSTTTVADIQSHVGFHQHRHDQSIFSILTKKYKMYSFGITENKAIHVRRNRTGVSNIKN